MAAGNRLRRYLDMLISGGLGLVLTALIVVGYITHESTVQLIELNRQVTNTHRILENLAFVKLQLEAADAAQRGFVLTGKERFAESFATVRDASLKQFAILRKLAVEDLGQQQALDAVQLAIDTRLTEEAAVIQTRRLLGEEKALERLDSERSTRLSEQIRSSLGELETSYNALLVQQSAESEAEARQTRIIIMAETGLAFAVVLLAASVLLARRSAQIALGRAEEKYREIFENSADGIYQCAPDGKFVTINPAMARLYGYRSTAAMLGDTKKPTTALSRRDEFQQAMQRDGAVQNFESRLTRPDGTV